MKYIYSLLIVLSLLLTGCSTYTIKDFPSKEKFYQSFNSSVGYKDIDITLTDNSQRTIYGGGTLKQDTLFTLTDVFPIETIKNINYRTKGGGGSILVGILSGVIVGGIAALLTNKSIHRLGDNEGPVGFYDFVLIGTGVLVGGVIGYFIGWNTTYQFNP
jgi:hypothetical protein